jgi:hypothetical protein
MHSLLANIAKGIPRKPSFTILMHNVNDLVHLSRTGSYWDGPETRAILIDNKIDRKLNETYGFFILVKNMLVPNIWLKTRHLFQGSIDKALNRDEWRSYRHKKFIYSEIEHTFNHQFRASLTSFIRVSRAWGIEPILMTQFNRLKKEDQFIRNFYESKANIENDSFLSYDEFVNLYSKGNSIVRDVSREENTLLIDLDKEIEPSSEFIFDAVHLNSKGSSKVAEVVIRFLTIHYPNYFYRKF